ncbi:MAG: polymer-forming cytoskeletal protein [Lachnospiraceae bacterium]|jgi:cytoskeletal protein CcmA (bactofilin family)|nr:polymer-forming cytoskeletal protein [Lachnospiraceae bacterium]
MSFFKEFKEDLSTAAKEMMPGGDNAENLGEGLMTEETEELVGEKMDEIDEMLREAVAPVKEPEVAPVPNYYQAPPTPTVAPQPMPSMEHMGRPVNAATEETAVITEGMTITGNVESTGSVEVRGSVVGDVRCNGKLVVTGSINGNTQSAEFFADNARIQGEIIAEGTVKIGNGSIIIGNLSATSSVIAGAVKGDIDVQGPVVVDTSAVVMGNIKSRSVQINNGAVIEGYCSQCYSDIDVQNVFG